MGTNNTPQSTEDMIADLAQRIKVLEERTKKRRWVPYAWVFAVGVQSIPATTWTRVAFDSNWYVDTSFFTFDSANEEVVCLKTGTYFVRANIAVEAGGGGQRYMRIRRINAARTSGDSPLGRINDSYAADCNEIEQSGIITMSAANMRFGFDVYTVGAANTRASTGDGTEYMYSGLQVLRLGDYS